MIAYLTIREVAEQMRCEHRTVRRAIKSGELQAAMIGGKWIIREDDVNTWSNHGVRRRRPRRHGPGGLRPRAVHDQMGLGA